MTTGSVIPVSDRPAPLDHYVSTIAICASIIVAVRLAKLADLDMSISNVPGTVQQVARLAQTILDESLHH